MTVVFGLGTRLCVHMCTKFEKDVLRNGQQPQSVVNDFEAMKMLSGRRAPCCQFPAIMTVITQTVYEISLLNIPYGRKIWRGI